MKRLVSLVMLFFFALTCGAGAREEFRVKNFRYSDTVVYFENGRLYGPAEILNIGGRWWTEKRKDGYRAYVKVTEKGAVCPVDLPLEADGTVDLSFFGENAGVSWKVNDKKEITFKASSEKKSVPISKDLILVWDPDSAFDADAPFFKEKDGDRVLSPEWGPYFAIGADASYVKRARAAHISVMPLIHNDFDPDATEVFMRDGMRKEQVIRRLTALSEVYGLDGWNIDFENMNPADKGRFTDFMKTLSERLHAKGKRLSVDILVLGSDDSYWNGAYDRAALADHVDYEIVMGYDQTSRLGGVPGPNSGADWLDRSMEALVSVVPPEKLVLGLPLYTRVWTGENGSGIRTDVLTHLYTENFVKENKIKPKWDKETKSYYADWKSNGVRRRVWLEEDKSLREKLKLIKKYHLAGSAWWRYEFEHPDLYKKLSGAV